jgi:adenylate kinase
MGSNTMRPIVLLTACCAVGSVAASGQPLVKGPVVVFIGAPGSGKTTQAAAAAKYLNVPIVSVAELLRNNARELKKVQTRGITGMEPETDPVLNKFFEARLNERDVANGMILDGYPNTNDHANFASNLVKTGVIPKPVILHLRIPDEIVRKRFASKDGTLAPSVEQRLKDYHRETAALKIYFPDADITDIDGTKKPGSVTKQVEAVLKARFRKK